MKFRFPQHLESPTKSESNPVADGHSVWMRISYSVRGLFQKSLPALKKNPGTFAKFKGLCSISSLVVFVRAGFIFTGRDRKSTRLNSSHVAISYAVFCLKKKITASH